MAVGGVFPRSVDAAYYVVILFLLGGKSGVVAGLRVDSRDDRREYLRLVILLALDNVEAARGHIVADYKVVLAEFAAAEADGLKLELVE